MRRAALALLFVACASGGNHNIGVTVFEAVTSTGFPVNVHGSHLLSVRIENQSHQEIVVHRIRIEPAGFFTEDPSQSVELLIGPGQMQSFEMYLNVSTSSRGRVPTSDLLDSVSVDLSCTGPETGDFIAGGTYQVNHVTSGG